LPSRVHRRDRRLRGREVGRELARLVPPRRVAIEGGVFHALRDRRHARLGRLDRRGHAVELSLFLRREEPRGAGGRRLRGLRARRSFASDPRLRSPPESERTICRCFSPGKRKRVRYARTVIVSSPIFTHSLSPATSSTTDLSRSRFARCWST